MNKIISTQDRVFMAVVGPTGCGKTELIFKMLSGNTFYPKFNHIIFFIPRIATNIRQNGAETWSYFQKVCQFRIFE